MIIERIKSYLRAILKYDQNELARRFREGADLPEGIGEYTPESAMRIATVYACVRVISETVASLPLKVMRRLPENGAEPAVEHPLYPLLAVKATRHETAFHWKERLTTHICLRGNHVSLKVREGGRVVRFLPVHPSRVTLEEYDDALIYRVADQQGQERRLLSEDVLHIPGLVIDGHWGLSPIGQVRETFDLARRVAKYGNSVFESGGAQRVVLKFPHPLGQKEKDHLRDSWREQGRDSAKTAVLEDGGDAAVVGMNADEAQYLETRKYGRTEICGIYRVPPHMVADLERATYSNIEKQDLYFGKHCIRPWCQRIEAVINCDNELIGDPRKYFVTFNLDALLRADIKTRTDALKTQFLNGQLTLNEWRGLENRNPIPGEVGNTHFLPNNLIPAERALAEPVAPAPVAPPEEGGGAGGSDNEPKAINFEPFARDLAQRLVGAELNQRGRSGDIGEFRDRQRVYAYKASAALFEAAGITDEQIRADWATQMVKHLEEGREIDIEHRQEEITATLMVALLPGDSKHVLKLTRWHARAVAARRAIEQAVAGQ